MALSAEEKAFFIKLGNRIAVLRKARDITQVQMAETLGVSQQTVNSYEVGRRRIPVSALPALAALLEVSVEDILDIGSHKASSKRGPAPKLQQQLDKVRQLPRAKQRFVSEMLDTVLQQASQ